MKFANRYDAGQQLALQLQHLRNHQPVVLALPRGGVPVAAVVAEALNAPLDVIVVRKIGAPLQSELAIGAVTDGGRPSYVLNDDVVRTLGIDERFLEQAVQREHAEVCRRQALYRSGRAPIEVGDRTAIVVDDGIATGATVRAALRSLRERSPQRLVLAVPVGPQEVAQELRRDVDELVWLHSPERFGAVGQFYSDFAQVSDDEVIRVLDEAVKRVESGAGR